MTSLPC